MEFQNICNEMVAPFFSAPACIFDVFIRKTSFVHIQTEQNFHQYFSKNRFHKRIDYIRFQTPTTDHHQCAVFVPFRMFWRLSRCRSRWRWIRPLDREQVASVVRQCGPDRHLDEVPTLLSWQSTLAISTVAYRFWKKKFSVVVLNKFRSCYNRCINKLFWFQRRDSMSGILMDLCLPTVDTVVHNSCVLFAQLCSVSSNKIVLWFDTVGVC